MIVARWILLSATLALYGQGLHEEDFKATMRGREAAWREMDAFALRLRDDTAASLGQMLRQRIGYPPPGMKVRGAMRIEKSGEDDVATYYRTWLPVGEGLEAYGLFIVPKRLVRTPAPLVISQHGGGGFPEMATYRGGSNYKDQVRGAVAEGYIVYAPQTVMYPFHDRDHGTAIPEAVRKELDVKFRAVGTSLAAVEVYKISLALDVLLKRPEIDAAKVAMIGLSYGGFHSLYTAALDPRIGVVVASCSFRDDPAIADGKTEGRLLDLAPAEVAALVAPRPLQIQSGVHDKLIPIEGSRRGAARARGYYEKLGATDRVVFEEFDGGHEFRGNLVWPFLRKWFGL
jgi:dienelactone hydrolase